MMTPEERVKARSEFKASLANMTKEELEALAAKLTEESKETDSKVANLNYTLENKGQKAAWDAIKTFLDKQSVKWNYALGLITLYEFFDKAQKEIMQSVKVRLKEVIAKIGKDRKYAFILNTDNNACPFVDGEQGEDITSVALELVRVKK